MCDPENREQRRLGSIDRYPAWQCTDKNKPSRNSSRNGLSYPSENHGKYSSYAIVPAARPEAYKYSSAYELDGLAYWDFVAVG